MTTRTASHMARLLLALGIGLLLAGMVETVVRMVVPPSSRTERAR